MQRNLSSTLAVYHFLATFLALGCASSLRAQATLSQNETISQTENSVPDPSRLFEPREFADEDGNILKYRLLKPREYDPSEKYPLVVFLHGAGERGDDNTAQLKHGMADFCHTDRRENFNCYVLAPQCPKEMKWANVDWSADSVELPADISTEMSLVLQVVEWMSENAAVDKRRIYITGLSMGGYGTWDALYRKPELFAAAAPICGGADPKIADAIKHIPVWNFHGDADKAVKVEFSRVIIDALKKAGGNPRYTEYAGVGHDSWTQTYSNDEFYTWLFSHRRKVAETTPAGAQDAKMKADR